MKRIAIVLGAIIALAVSCQAANRPNWRGPDSKGVAEAGKYPVKFSATRNVAWKVKLPGKGSSTPIVWGDNIIITCGIGKGNGGRDGVLCFDRKGNERWRRELGPQRPGKHRNGSGSCPSATTDGKRIFVYFKSGTVAGLDFDGKVLWTRNLQKEYGKCTLWWDLGTSPVLAGGNVVVAVMHDGPSYLVALDQATGKTAWKTDRTYKCPREADQSYTTPIVMEQSGKTAIVVWGADHLTAHDAADGSLMWECGGFNPKQTAMWRVIASPVASDGVAVVPYGRGNFLAGIKLGGSGDVTKTHRLWERDDIGSDVPTPIATNGKLYQLTDKGTLACIDIKTGKDLWSKKLPDGRGKVYSSPVLAGDRMYAARESGVVYVLKIKADGADVLAVNDMGDRLAATPVLIDDMLLLRGVNYLYCIVEK